MILSQIFNQDQEKNIKSKKLKDEILKWHKDFKRVKRKEEEITKSLKELDISERARLLFNLWAVDDAYGKMMQKHTNAIKILLGKEVDSFFPSYFLDKKRALNNKNSPLIVFEPFVGNGDVTINLLKTMANYYYEKTKRKLEVVLYINDIAENMIALAKKRLKLLNHKDDNLVIVDLFSFSVDFLDDNKRQQINLSLNSVDVAIVSQVLDVIRGIEAKNKVLTILHDYLKIGGRMIVIGEDPSRFTLESESDPLVALLFKTLFDPFGKNETETEIKRIRNGRLVIVGEGTTPIDDVHSVFLRTAEKIYRESEKKENEIKT
ncbi:MAG: class I SAM-dependent methyltransferase [Candidatus Bilamarchaeaceae archaeon]